jgi:hypothetical protein
MCGAETPGSRYEFCSMVCAVKSRSGSGAHNWKGGRLTQAVCEKCGKEYQASRFDRGRFCSLECYRSSAATAQQRPHSRANGGKRADLGDRYFRSSWEANWARYLNWLVSLGEIVEWSYEPETFEFGGIKRGARFYTPDFCITEKSGEILYHEVKGWMDPRSATKLARMGRYHPNVRIIVVDRKAYQSVARKIGKALPGWEWNQKHSM